MTEPKRLTTSVISNKNDVEHLTRHTAEILTWTVLHRLIVAVLLVGASRYVRLFDTSPEIQLILDGSSNNVGSRWARNVATCFLRWDTLHFLAAASPRPLPESDISPASRYALHSTITASGLALEQSLAWQPGIVWLLKVGGYDALRNRLSSGEVSWDPIQAILVVSMLATIASCLSPLLLHRLTLRMTKDQGLARLTALLSILSTSPATLITPTPESFYSLFALLGHAALTGQRGWTTLRRFLAACSFMLATCFRANGIMLSGFLVWDVFFTLRPGTQHRLQRLSRLSLTAVCLFICTISFCLYQVWAFSRFCTNVLDSRPWCRRAIPSAYAFVQSHYWDVGPFRYWTISQLPNWILSAPAIGLAGLWIYRYFSSAPDIVLQRTLAPLSRSNSSSSWIHAGWRRPSLCDVRSAPGLLPHAYFSVLTLALLTITSHVQIVLRFASPGGLPAVWWGATTLFLLSAEYDTWQMYGKGLVTFLVLWNITSVLLYTGFYPPA